MKAQFEKVPEINQPFFIKKRIDPKFEFLWHFHPEYELTLILTGQGRRFVGDNIANYEAGDLVLIGPNLPHTWCSEGDCGRLTLEEALVLQFAAALFDPGYLAEPEMAHVKRLLERAAQGVLFIGQTGETAARRLLELYNLKGLPRLASFLVILDELGKSAEYQTLSSPGFALDSHPDNGGHQINKVCRFINSKFTDSISEREAAANAHMSIPAFTRFFKKTTGRTFTSYLNELRISYACRLLIESDLRISEIAFKAGFRNLSNFNRRFLNLKRVSPKIYRQQMIESASNIAVPG
jgi:AraC-like DNA-binding protein